jgi:hypothetical protein
MVKNGEEVRCFGAVLAMMPVTAIPAFAWEEVKAENSDIAFYSARRRGREARGSSSDGSVGDHFVKHCLIISGKNTAFA